MRRIDAVVYRTATASRTTGISRRSYSLGLAPDAVTLKDRTYEHLAQPMSGAKPVTVGQGYSTIAWIPEESGSWALPLSEYPFVGLYTSRN